MFKKCYTLIQPLDKRLKLFKIRTIYLHYKYRTRYRYCAILKT